MVGLSCWWLGVRTRVAKRAILGIGASTYHLCWPLGSCPPPKWGADEVVDLVPSEQHVVRLLPLVLEFLHVCELVTNDVQQERGMSTLA